jgi:hypothetical protein
MTIFVDMEEFIESQGYVTGGVYKVSTSKLEQILENYKKELFKDLSEKYPNDADLGAEIRKTK